jgi:hypothetical protein
MVEIVLLQAASSVMVVLMQQVLIMGMPLIRATMELLEGLRTTVQC